MHSLRQNNTTPTNHPSVPRNFGVQHQKANLPNVHMMARPNGKVLVILKFKKNGGSWFYATNFEEAAYQAMIKTKQYERSQQNG